VITAERAYLQVLEGSCQIPVGVFGQILDGKLQLEAVVLSLDGTKKISDVIHGSCDDAAALGKQLAERMLAAGGSELLAVLTEDSGRDEA
jgi:hydroxymethylbilane synthase